ncbi:hypothetical protein PAPYR_12922 [Paratrimastix pyriformis]|uniref:Uncharacterized protein n=1 Tax=Paratrimastix pyriformis TaxID=342808 RepID=A0ABQ8U5F4_9EUKA|nr:hypothetical protein PAPYR_12922 [Paratrimastix pyriformis]
MVSEEEHLRALAKIRELEKELRDIKQPVVQAPALDPVEAAPVEAAHALNPVEAPVEAPAAVPVKKWVRFLLWIYAVFFFMRQAILQLLSFGLEYMAEAEHPGSPGPTLVYPILNFFTAWFAADRWPGKAEGVRVGIHALAGLGAFCLMCGYVVHFQESVAWWYAGRLVQLVTAITVDGISQWVQWRRRMVKSHTVTPN